MKGKQNATGWAFLLPAIILICAFSLYPMISALITSFQTGTGVNIKFAGLSNYIRCFKDDVFIQSLKNCAFYLIIKVASLHNSTLLDEWYPPISCISFDVDELGREASRLLYVYLTEGKRLPLSILGYEIKMKDSTI